MREQPGDRIKALRLKAKETQPALAHAIGTNTTSVSRWENNKGKPHLDNLAALAQHYGVTPDYILTGVSHASALDSDAFREFLGTEYGRIAQKNGWLEGVRNVKPPLSWSPSAEFYIEYVNILLREQRARQKKDG